MLEPFGFHLSDGVLHTYLRGNEYESTAWDWNFIPGITVDYGATPLNCDGAATSGVEAFVGGVSTGQCGVATMRYTNPTRQTALHWQKAWFFLQHDVQHVMVSGVASSSGAPVYTVLDQRLHNGSIMVDGSAQRQSMNSTIALSLFGMGMLVIVSQNRLPFQRNLELRLAIGLRLERRLNLHLR